MPEENKAPSIADASTANAGRIYDYVLGGHHNFEVDRIAAKEILKLLPDYPELARYVRWFLGEAARRLAAEGFTRFVDFASGLPTVDHIHKVTPPGTKVIYSDIDPVTVAYGRDVIKDVPNARYMVCNAGEPEALLGSALTAEFLGTSRKVAFGFNGIVFFLTDQQISHAMNAMYDWAEDGSRLFLCDSDVSPALRSSEIFSFWTKVGQPIYLRSTEELQRLTAPWKPGQGFKPIDEWVGIKMRPENKKSPFADTLRGAILEK